jgi:hypothetical protein
LRALHSLGAGVGDPTDGTGTAHGIDRTGIGVPVAFPSPSGRNTASAPAIAGVTPGGDALGFSFTSGDHLTLLAFLSTGCATCGPLWASLGESRERGLPGDVRLIVVTKGPEHEVPAEVTARSPHGTSVVMSTDAWIDFEVPGSPFFVLVDGRTGRRIGEGVAQRFEQVVELVRRAQMDAHGPGTRSGPSPAIPGIPDVRVTPGADWGPADADRLDGPERESANDAALTAAGVLPGDPSLYPRSLAAVFGRPDDDPT